jgi:P27 family predicted phage terminase small subunit
MTRGRKPKPTHLKLVGGNAGKRALPKNEPKPTGNLKEPPNWLTDSQQVLWDYAISSAPQGLLKRLDQSVLVSWVVAADLHRQAAEKLNGGAMLIKTPNGMPVQSPYLAIVNKQAAIMIKAASEMGFTPSSRSRVEVENGAEEDAADRFFG